MCEIAISRILSTKGAVLVQCYATTVTKITFVLRQWIACEPIRLEWPTISKGRHEAGESVKLDVRSSYDFLDVTVSGMLIIRLICVCSLLALALHSQADADDLVEFLSGAKANGSVKSIRKEQKEFDLEVTVAGRKLVRTYPFSKVHAVTMNGKRFELTKMPSETEASSQRSKPEVLELIQTVGSTHPDWFAETKLNYPTTLDLSWPLKPPIKKWNGRVNVGQHLWDTVYPNTGRWKSGVKLIYQIMSTHQDDPVLLSRDMRKLGSTYFNLFQDYPRAAYWFQQTKEQSPLEGEIPLAECYWRLGNEEMALELMRGRDLPLRAIKLLGDMGYADRAVSLANRYAKSSQSHMALLMGGDAFRSAGKYDDAVKMYQRVISAGNARNEQYTARFRGRAKDSMEAIRLMEKARVDMVSDGKYRDKSVGYNGPIEVEVVVASQKITSVRVTSHKEKQYYAALTDTPNQILVEQSIQGIDGTSGATITSVAITNAVSKALASGAK